MSREFANPRPGRVTWGRVGAAHTEQSAIAMCGLGLADCGAFSRLMSALGQKQTFTDYSITSSARASSAGGTLDMCSAKANVRFWPKADISQGE